ncbi:ABC transporter permease [Actinomyces culturomici]|uniref:ABC transporter permease n=1 Tax=Actinomyces culturomici TaxID=1926276 RepID=UPI000E204D03|nr:ABC transporter permease [Actinomyces culturomici]
MRFLNQLIGALVEAWGEVKVQKARVVLSLVGVVAAVAAMSTVIALGDLVVQSNREMMEAQTGRSITLHITANKKASDDGSDDSGAASTAYSGPTTAVSNVDGTPVEESSNAATASEGVVHDPMGDAMTTVAQRFAIPYWARLETGSAEFTELAEVQQTGSFRGRAVPEPQWGYQTAVTVNAVDPAYSTLFRLRPMSGRWIAESDADQRLVPVVINSILWDYLGRSPIEDPIILHAKDGSGAQYRVVGVIKAKSTWDSPTLYVDYTAWQYSKTRAAEIKGEAQAGGASVEMLVWAGEGQAEQARKVLPSALASVLGAGWEGSVYGGEQWDGGQSEMGTVRTVIMIIGGIVIFLGALGLLNVAIVTVRQRIREIGIRRAMGASATRVFFAVFMESVVATFVAGVIGVGLAIVALRFIPLESMDVMLQERPAFPMGAAIDGVAISTSIGALCGIIPAVAAVKVKPIDAIRY